MQSWHKKKVVQFTVLIILLLLKRIQHLSSAKSWTLQVKLLLLTWSQCIVIQCSHQKSESATLSKQQHPINCLTSYLIQSDTGTKSGVHLGKVATLSEGQHRERESAILKHIFGLSEEVRVKFILAYCGKLHREIYEQAMVSTASQVC